MARNTTLSRICHRTLRFERLEERRVLATFTVTNLNDATVTGPGSAPGTLRQAIFDANASSDADTIDFVATLAGDLRLSTPSDSSIGLSALLITSPITIQGNAAGITIKRDITAPEMRFFRVASVGDLTLNSLNLTGGITRGSAGIAGQNGGSAFAGAIYNQGNLQLYASTLYDNTTIGGTAGAGANSGAGQGGAVFNDGGNLTVRNSTLSGNSALNGFGAIVARSFGGNIYSKNGLSVTSHRTIRCFRHSRLMADQLALTLSRRTAPQLVTAQTRSISPAINVATHMPELREPRQISALTNYNPSLPSS